MVSSRPAWGAWIEMLDGQVSLWEVEKSRPAWGAWIEIFAVLEGGHIS